MKALWNRLFRKRHRKLADRRQTHGYKSLGVETLESRTLLAVAPIALNAHCGNLTLTGGAGPDNLRMEVAPDQANVLRITLNGSVATFQTSQIRNISVKLNGGDDKMVTEGNLSWPGLKKFTISTDGGNDEVWLSATNAAVTVKLGTGNDKFFATCEGLGSLRINADGGDDFLDARWWRGPVTFAPGKGNDIAIGPTAGAQAKFLLQGDNGFHDEARGRATDKFCLDSTDSLTFWQNVSLPRGVVYDVSVRTLTIDLGKVPSSFGYWTDPANRHLVGVCWDGAFGQEVQMFQVDTLVIRCPNWESEVTVDGFAGNVIIYGSDACNHIVTSNCGPVTFYGGPGDTWEGYCPPKDIWYGKPSDPPPAGLQVIDSWNDQTGVATIQGNKVRLERVTYPGVDGIFYRLWINDQLRPLDRRANGLVGIRAHEVFIDAALEADLRAHNWLTVEIV